MSTTDAAARQANISIEVCKRRHPQTHKQIHSHTPRDVHSPTVAMRRAVSRRCHGTPCHTMPSRATPCQAMPCRSWSTHANFNFFHTNGSCLPSAFATLRSCVNPTKLSCCYKIIPRLICLIYFRLYSIYLFCMRTLT